MLRRSCSLFYIHRTLTGATIKPSNPEVLKRLDRFVDQHKIPTSPAVYWVTTDIASRNHVKILQQTCEKVPLENILTTEEIQEHSKMEAEGGEENSDFLKNTQVSIFPLAKTDCPSLRPAHINKHQEKKFAQATTQTILESVAARRGYSSLVWYSAQHLIMLQNKNQIDRDLAARHPPVPISTTTAANGSTEVKFFNSDVLFLSSSQEKSSSSSSSAQQNYFTQTNFNTSASETENSLDLLCDTQRFGSGKPMPFKTAQELLLVKRARNFKSNKWFTPKHMIEINLHPKKGEEIIVVMRADGSLFRCFNGDQLESGLVLNDMIKLKAEASAPMLATPEMEKRATAAKIFLDAEGSEIFQDDKRKAVQAFHQRRANPEAASRQYFTSWDLSLLGYEPFPGSSSATLFSGGGTKIVLFNRDDCGPVNPETGMLMMATPNSADAGQGIKLFDNAATKIRQDILRRQKELKRREAMANPLEMQVVRGGEKGAKKKIKKESSSVVATQVQERKSKKKINQKK
jgi:hypothetical protein